SPRAPNGFETGEKTCRAGSLLGAAAVSRLDSAAVQADRARVGQAHGIPDVPKRWSREVDRHDEITIDLLGRSARRPRRHRVSLAHGSSGGPAEPEWRRADRQRPHRGYGHRQEWA